MMNSLTSYTQPSCLYNDLNSLSAHEVHASLVQGGYQPQALLEKLQEFNLLCENEVKYYSQEKFNTYSPLDLVAAIQERVVYHRVHEEKIKNSLGEKGGFIKLSNGSRVEGSVGIGGIQPDYIIDSHSPTIQNFLDSLDDLKNAPIFKKILRFGERLRNVIKRTEYEDKKYRDLLQSYREKKLEIPLSEYMKHGVGTCREIALLTTLGLGHLGLDANYYYSKVQTANEGEPAVVEDHALVLVRLSDSEVLVVDNYFRAFNMFSLDMVLSGVSSKGGLMHDAIEKAPTIHAKILNSRLYPTARHLTR